MTDAAAADREAHLDDIVRQFSTAMLVTRGMDGHLRARPMWLAEIGEDGRVVLVTRQGSPKVAEIHADGEATVTFQRQEQFAAISGPAKVVDDRALVERLWRAEWQVWFPGGKADPSLRLIVINGERGEYWDNSGEPGREYRFKAAQALQQGTQPRTDEQQHGKVDLEAGRSAAG